MLLHLPAVLTRAQLDSLLSALRLDAAPWTDGRVTAGHQSARVKHNEQLEEASPMAREFGALVLAALERNPLFVSAALPNRVSTPLFNRYRPGMQFGEHVDSAIRMLPLGQKLRTDLSATVFLSPTDSYQGGELVVEDDLGSQSIKLDAGDDGSGYDRSDTAVKVFDTRNNPSDCGQFYGLTLSASAGRLYVADFGTDTSTTCHNAGAVARVPGSFRIRVFGKTLNADGTLLEITDSLDAGNAFPNPFVGDPHNIKAGDYVPWNIAAIGTSLFVAYVQVQQDPNGAEGAPYPANEVHGPSAGRLAEFDTNGNLIAVWQDGGRLNAPWGMALAPANFGVASNQLLVGNFGDYDLGGSHGALVAFDVATRTAKDVVRNSDGTPLLIPGIWGIVFGNGDTLGDSNALYYAAGPNGEADGLFGVVRQAAASP